jgi:hypothetical protein
MKIKYVFAASFEIEYCFDKHGHLNILEWSISNYPTMQTQVVNLPDSIAH